MHCLKNIYGMWGGQAGGMNEGGKGEGGSGGAGADDVIPPARFNESVQLTLDFLPFSPSLAPLHRPLYLGPRQEAIICGGHDLAADALPTSSLLPPPRRPLLHHRKFILQPSL